MDSLEVAMIGIPLGLLFANGVEWGVHKYLLHEHGRNRDSFWAFHWHTHHKHSRRYGHYDPDYRDSVLQWNGQGKEALAVAGLAVSMLPLAPVAPFFVATTTYSAVNYYFKHKRAHLDPDWAREKLPWHYDHHMGSNQDANWCVTRPWFDRLMGTREPYVDTEKELAKRANDVERFTRASRSEPPTAESVRNL
jgi:sterol desaturase/sphingolipid hydroxylase (fatty acid hydroxylase superfamily)